MLDSTPAMPTAIIVSIRVKPRLQERRKAARRRRLGAAAVDMEISLVQEIQQAAQPGTAPKGVHERTRPMTLTMWCTARPRGSRTRRVPVGVLVPCSGSNRID